MTDSQGRVVNFKNTVIIMTSNIGAPHLLEGITDEGEIREGARDAVMRELRRHFRPEFLNRVDETVLFRPLQLSEIERIVDLQVGALRSRLAAQRIGLRLTDAARKFIARAAYDPVYGARPLKRYLQREVETLVARGIITGSFTEGTTVVADVIEGGLRLRSEAGVAEVAGAG